MKTPIPGGFLVAVEGIDGTGKSTVAAATPRRQAASRVEAKKAVAQFIGKPLRNNDSFTAILSGNSLAKMLSKSAIHKSVNQKSHLAAVANADQLFVNATREESKSDRAGDANIAAIHRYFAPMLFGEEVLLVKFTVKEITTAPNLLYTIETLKIEKPDRSSSKNEVERVDDTEAARQTFQSGFSKPLQQKIEAVKKEMDQKHL